MQCPSTATKHELWQSNYREANHMSYDYGWQEPADGFGCQPVPSCVTIELDGIEFTGTAPAGSGYGLTGWSGWDTSAETRGGEQEYETADGGYETPVYLASREITLEGRIVARSMAERNRMRGELGRILAVNRRAPMVVAEDYEGLERQADVRRVGRVMLTNDTPKTAIFTLQLKAAAAVRVDASESSVTLTPGEGAQLLTNEGDYPANLRATLNGPLTDPIIANGKVSSDWWKYSGTIPADQVRVVDFTRRTVTDGRTATQYRRLVSGVWPKVEPDGQTRKLIAAGSGSATLTWRSTWV